jgi:hypothetical protein
MIAARVDESFSITHEDSLEVYRAEFIIGNDIY